MSVSSKVLIADDDELVVELARAHLAPKGYEVVHAADGESTLRLAQSAQPALILLDVMMPGVDGMEVLRRLSMDDRSRQIPVIMLTSKRSQDDVMAALKLGARDYLGKPFTPETLIAKVERLLGKRLI